MLKQQHIICWHYPPLHYDDILTLISTLKLFVNEDVFLYMSNVTDASHLFIINFIGHSTEILPSDLY